MVTKEKEQGFFGSLALSHKVMAAIQAMGFEEPSPIQAKTIPPIMEGLDVIGQAQTGTGKTAAFGIPIIEKVQDSRHVQALIMTPTSRPGRARSWNGVPSKVTRPESAVWTCSSSCG